jgi:tRNA threonylcarbamoyl adenosine modification protein (Sua5/YciO/YrdC/YwlC family)
MRIIDKEYVESHKDEIISAIKSGKIFIYPTDTIYGLGCSALLSNSVQRLREIKKRDTKPFSIIAPSKEWILENCEVAIENLNKYFPGPFTLFLNRRNKCVAEKVNPIDNTLGVRIPDHWFTQVVEEAGVPFVTTSVNLSGEPHMEKLDDLSQSVLEQVDYVVYEGEKKGQSSEKVNLT